ncbi:apolipoprotein N-acyltransferase [Tateyamaria omphalii]|uniref:Apolipoprotein N-acyltransferase n=1 Tax=Tateyamaria omphalii TaxID=299262 RepID=A0A1P8MS27_9RHOB|nr:apolipoprotein N-acyltransferase [Tateyamaria omphalii]APX10855.1 apolipoprotein N-acyltransferase [Tateyamaria omphalii]
MTRLRARIEHAPIWAQVPLAMAAGAAGSFAHAPFDLPIAILIPLIAAFGLLSIARSVTSAGLLGLALGAGYFAATLTWIVEPFQVDAATTGWMAPFALLFMSVGLGLFWAAALALSRWAGAHSWVLVFAMTGTEMLRAYLLTGFPWATPPQALVGGMAGHLLSWAGPHGTMLVMMAAAGLAWAVPREWVKVAIVVALAAVIDVIPLRSADSPLTDKTVRLIQPNAPQQEKWDPARIPTFINRQIDYTADGDVPDLVVWPETALPYLLDQAQPALDVIAEAARGAPVVLGIQREEAEQYYNSLVTLDATGHVTQIYDKHHLVPFGEYMPLPGLFRRLGIQSIAERVDGGYTPGPGPQLLDMGPLGKALPLICYEAVFAHDVGASPERPDFLMQLTNDAWFGMRSGPQQHLAQAQMRAIEQGLPLIRAANTGISAVIDPEGRITASLALNQAGYMDARLPAPGAPTLYSRTGDLPWVLLVMLGLIGAVLHRAQTRRAQPIDAPAPEA